MSDKEMFLNIIKCAQKAIITGLPEADIPTHDPLTITRNFTLDVNIGTYK